jgi:hypothetical protein
MPAASARVRVIGAMTTRLGRSRVPTVTGENSRRGSSNDIGGAAENMVETTRS